MKSEGTGPKLQEELEKHTQIMASSSNKPRPECCTNIKV